MRLLTVVVCFAVLCGCSPPPAVRPTPPKASSGVSTSQLPDNDPSVKLVAMTVPHMTCQHNCWPEVKKTLEAQEGVAKVTLSKQPNEDEVVDKTVFIAVKGNFDAQAAIEALGKNGFDESKVIDN